MFENGKVDFTLVQMASKDILARMLSGVPGNKAIVWEKELAGTFSLVGDFTFLRDHGVVQMFYLSGDNICAPNNPNTHLIFITKPHTASMDLINKYVRGLSARGHTSSHSQLHLWLVPRTSLLCERRLQEHGLLDSFQSVTDLPLLLFKMEPDLVSMELPQAFAECAVSEYPESTHLVARALMMLQSLFGPIPTIRGKGPCVTALYNMMVELRREMAYNEPEIPTKIDQLIILDRSIDLITPLATQLTYQGLIDQCFGIKNCVVKLPASKFENGQESSSELTVDTQSDPLKSIPLSSADPLYAELRDYNFSAVGPKLAQQAKQITKDFEERHTAKTVVEMKQFVQKLPKIQAAKQSLALHTNLTELLQEELGSPFFSPAFQFEQELLRGAVDCDKPSPFVEDLMWRKAPLLLVLRLLCLMSVLNNGLKQKLVEQYKRELLQCYGHHHILTLDNLSRAGLLTVQQAKSNYLTIRKTLRLIVDDVNERNPTDIAYVHSGYAPLSVRIARFVHTPGWRAITDLLSLLPGPTLAEAQHISKHRRTDSSSGGGLGGEGEVVLVFFVGGCTNSEIAAFRHLTEKHAEKGGPEYIIATTSILTSDSFLKTLSTNLLPN